MTGPSDVHDYDETAKKLQSARQNELNEGTGEEANEERETQRHLTLTRAAEVRVVRNLKALVSPPDIDGFHAQAVVVDADGVI